MSPDGVLIAIGVPAFVRLITGVIPFQTAILLDAGDMTYCFPSALATTTNPLTAFSPQLAGSAFTR